MRDTIRVVDILDESSFRFIPPCADPGFDHRSCDYWEDAERGSKATRLSWHEPAGSGSGALPAAAQPSGPNPFLADLQAKRTSSNPFLTLGDDDGLPHNPFMPRSPKRIAASADGPRKLQLLGRGLGIAGSYAKVLIHNEVAAVYAQFGPLTAYPRAQRTRDLYPALPDAPLPAVITCIATTKEAHGLGLAKQLVAAVCDDLTTRGFTAVESYPSIGVPPDATSAASPQFWESVGFTRAIDDPRFPVMRRELG